ncbi:hypothetical protein LY90DRAFT_671895, partial [Neocallimastix californiae]
MDQRTGNNNKGKKAFNYKRNRNNSSENKRNFKHSRSNSNSNSHSSNSNNDDTFNFGMNNDEKKKNKFKNKENYLLSDNINNNSSSSGSSSSSNNNNWNYNSNNASGSFNNNGKFKINHKKNSLSKSVLLKQSLKHLKDNKKNYYLNTSSKHFRNNNKHGHGNSNYSNNYNNTNNNGYEASSSNSNYHSISNYHFNNNSTSSNNNNDTSSSSNTTDNNNEPTILNIPGYYYDKEKKKYFKIQKNGVSTSSYSQSSVKEKEKEEKSKLQQDMESLKIKNNTKNNNIRTLMLNRELGNLTGNNNIEKYIYNNLFSNIKCQQTTRHREISHMSLSTSGKVIALGHVNGYASIKVRGHINNENSIYSCASVASSAVSSIKVFENDNYNYHIFASSLGGEAEPGTVSIYKYILNNANEDSIPLLSLIQKVVYKNSTIQCCSISDSLDSYITIADRCNALIHPNINSICSGIKHHKVSMPTKTDIMIQKNTTNNLSYNGCRNGSIEVIDLQNLKLNTSKNFVQHSSCVCDIQQVNDTLFVSSSMDGGIYIWDIRGGTSSTSSSLSTSFYSPENNSTSSFSSDSISSYHPPSHYRHHHSSSHSHSNHNKNWVVQELQGNCNEYLKNNIAVDSEKGIIITAGQDGQLRAWNLYNGEMILSKHLPNYVHNTTTTIQWDRSDHLIGFW